MAFISEEILFRVHNSRLVGSSPKNTLGVGIWHKRATAIICMEGIPFSSINNHCKCKNLVITGSAIDTSV